MRRNGTQLLGGSRPRIGFGLCLAVAVAVAVAAAVSAPAASAHSGGKAEPLISAGLSGTGLTRDLRVRLTDADSGDPVTGATVAATASMSVPHTMQLAPVVVPETRPGTYEGRIRLLMPADWTFRIGVSGPRVVAASATLKAKVGRASPGSAGSTGASDPAALPTRVEAVLARTDYLTMAVLWLHGLAALGWIVGVVVMAVALASDPALLGDGVRPRLSRWYRRVGAWLHWALVPVIVATGIYNMQRVTPFALAWSPSAVRRLGEVPYGALYEAILIVKLGLFAALLITGTQVLRRTLHGIEPSTEIRRAGAVSTLRSSLGAPGLVYLASIPLILAAAMALRYVHILSHVAVVLDQR